MFNDRLQQSRFSSITIFNDRLQKLYNNQNDISFKINNFTIPLFCRATIAEFVPQTLTETLVVPMEWMKTAAVRLSTSRFADGRRRRASASCPVRRPWPVVEEQQRECLAKHRSSGWPGLKEKRCKQHDILTRT